MGRRVLAFDIATRTGFAVVEDADPMPRVIEAGVIDLSKIKAYEHRLQLLFGTARLLIERHAPLAAVFYECPPGWQGKTQAHTLRTLWQLGAVVQLAVAYSGTGAQVWGVTPTDWQHAMLGSGLRRAALKERAKEQLRLRTGYETDDPDIADAGCQALYGLGLMRLGMLEQRLAHAR